MFKKKVLFVIFILMQIASILFSQNSYYQYYCDDGINNVLPLCDTINHRTYIVSVNEAKNEISAGILTDGCPQGMINNTLKCFQLHTAYGPLVLNGGFVDFDGDIVVYGAYCNDTIRTGAIVKLHMNSGVVSYVRHIIAPGEVRDGCFGIGRNESKVYYFVTNNRFFRLNNNLGTIDIYYPHRNLKEIPNARDLSIEYDYSNDRVILGGSLSDTTVFYTTLVSRNLNIGSVYSFYKIRPQEGYWFDTHTMSINILGNGLFSNDTIYIAQDLRDDYNSYIWLLKINYTNGDITHSAIYSDENYITNLSIISIQNNFDKLFVLCLDMTARKVMLELKMHYLNSYALYSVFSYSITNSMLYGIFQHKDICLNNISFNYNTWNIIGGGRKKNMGLLYDGLGGSICDYYINSTYSELDYCSFSEINMETFDYNPDVIIVSSYRNGKYTLFSDCVNCSLPKSKNDYNDDELYSKGEKKSHDNIDISMIDGNSFICNGFCGNCQYTITDYMGKIVYKNSTQNNVKTPLPQQLTGLCILSVFDNCGNFKSVKIIN